MFLALAALVAVKGDDLPWFDDVVFRSAERIQQQQVNSFVRFIGRLGGTEVVVPIGIAVAGIVSLTRRSLSPLAIVLLAYAFAAWWTLRFKHLVERHEPFDHPTDLGLSFPSGHMSQSVSVYVVLLVLVGGYERHRLFRVLIALGMLIVFDRGRVPEHALDHRRARRGRAGRRRGLLRDPGRPWPRAPARGA